jgi:DNA-binding MarR family transcriptional regulator
VGSRSAAAPSLLWDPAPAVREGLAQPPFAEWTPPGRDRILAALRAAGAPLCQRELARRTGLSRSAVQWALRGLRSEGWLGSSPGARRAVLHRLLDRPPAQLAEATDRLAERLAYDSVRPSASPAASDRDLRPVPGDLTEGGDPSLFQALAAGPFSGGALRVAMALLGARKPLSQRGLARATGLALSTVQHALARLAEAGILEVARRGARRAALIRFGPSFPQFQARPAEASVSDWPNLTDPVGQMRTAPYSYSLQSEEDKSLRAHAHAHTCARPLAGTQPAAAEVSSAGPNGSEAGASVTGRERVELEARALHRLLGFPGWLQRCKPEARKLRTAELIRRYLDSCNPRSLFTWIELATAGGPAPRMRNPAAWLYHNLVGYGQLGWKPTRRDGQRWEWVAAVLEADLPKARVLLHAAAGREASKARDEARMRERMDMERRRSLAARAPEAGESPEVEGAREVVGAIDSVLAAWRSS